MSSARESGRGLKQTQVPMRLEITETWRVFFANSAIVWFIDLRFRERNRVAERLDHIFQKNTSYSKKKRR